MLNFWPYYIREVWTTRLAGLRRIALFGAGEHTRWLLDLVQTLPGPKIEFLLDDKAGAIREIKGIPVIRPDAASVRGGEGLDAVVVSSDSAEERIFVRATEAFPRLKVLRLYEGLPPGPYDKQGELPAGIDTIGGPGDFVNLETIVQVAGSAATKLRLAEVFNRMDADPYAKRLADGYAKGVDRFGDAWRYVDLWSMLYACARLTGLADYLEIGTRRGHSLAAVLAGSADGRADRSDSAGPALPAVVSCDRWIAGYADAENPGPDFVVGQLRRLGLDPKIEFLSGSSHELVGAFLRSSGRQFDLITVDGDHSRDGARQDLLDVIGSLRLGGVLLFDDINHPQHAYLGQVWRDVVAGRCGYETYENPRNGTGIAAALRYRSE
ncbi:MAG: hypothetical protein FLDDKLPJ_01524 [Phycisphaerae bacterium]|nr:hypothetical protein [Phycisphaerae bacterium]